MPVVRPYRSVSRRAFIALAGGARLLAQHAEELPSEARRYLDGATEFPVLQLTSPEHTSLLPASWNRCASTRNFVVFSNDRFGKFDAFRMDLKSGQWRRLTGAAALDPASLALTPSDRSICYIDGKSVRSADTSARSRERELYSLARGFERLGSLAVGTTTLYVVESKEGASRVRAVPLGQGAVADIVESETITGLVPRPTGGLAFRTVEGIRYVDPQKRQQALKLATGITGPMYWSPDGASLLYLNIPARLGELNSVREYVLATGEDRLIAKTTQFVQFAPNRDATVFVGASGSKASPHVLILLRTTRRELTLCEHRARNAGVLAVVFTPNSQRILFQSDQAGKPAIYSMAVERFVEETES